MAGSEVPDLLGALRFLELRQLLRAAGTARAWRAAARRPEAWRAVRLTLSAGRSGLQPPDAEAGGGCDGLPERNIDRLGGDALFHLASSLVCVARASGLAVLPETVLSAAQAPRPGAAAAGRSSPSGRSPSELEVAAYRFGGTAAAVLRPGGGGGSGAPAPAGAIVWALQYNASCLERTQALADDALGLKVWPPCSVLCHHFSGPDAPLLAGRRVLELGAGIGLLGVQLARRGAQVTVTEASELCLRVARVNARLNGVEGSCRFRALDWGAEAATALLAAGEAPFDYVIGADVVYVDKAAEQLFETAALLLAPTGCFYLGYVDRHRNVTAALKAAAAMAGFRVEAPRHIGKQLLLAVAAEGAVDAMGDAISGLDPDMTPRVDLYTFVRRGAFRLDLMD